MKYRRNVYVQNCNFNLVAYAPQSFIFNMPKKNGQQIFREWAVEYSGKEKFCSGYISVEIIEAVIGWIKEKIITEPAWAENLHKETEKINWDYFNFAKDISGRNLGTASKRILFQIITHRRKTLRKKLTRITKNGAGRHTAILAPPMI